MENGMQEFAPDATTTPAGSVHQHRCGMKKSSLNINFFFENQIFFLVLKAFCNLLWWHQNIDKDVKPWNRTVGQTSPKNYETICIPKTFKIFLKFRAIIARFLIFDQNLIFGGKFDFCPSVRRHNTFLKKAKFWNFALKVFSNFLTWKCMSSRLILLLLAHSVWISHKNVSFEFSRKKWDQNCSLGSNLDFFWEKIQKNLKRM